MDNVGAVTALGPVSVDTIAPNLTLGTILRFDDGSDALDPRMTVLSGGESILTVFRPDEEEVGQILLYNYDRATDTLQLQSSVNNVSLPSQSRSTPHLLGGYNQADRSYASASLPNGNFVLAWQAVTDIEILYRLAIADKIIIKVQQFDTDGTQIGEQHKLMVPNFSAGRNTHPQITVLEGGGYVAVWRGL